MKVSFCIPLNFLELIAGEYAILTQLLHKLKSIVMLQLADEMSIWSKDVVIEIEGPKGTLVQATFHILMAMISLRA